MAGTCGPRKDTCGRPSPRQQCGWLIGLESTVAAFEFSTWEFTSGSAQDGQVCQAQEAAFPIRRPRPQRGKGIKGHATPGESGTEHFKHSAPPHGCLHVRTGEPRRSPSSLSGVGATLPHLGCLAHGRPLPIQKPRVPPRETHCPRQPRASHAGGHRRSTPFYASVEELRRIRPPRLVGEVVNLVMIAMVLVKQPLHLRPGVPIDMLCAMGGGEGGEGEGKGRGEGGGRSTTEEATTRPSSFDRSTRDVPLAPHPNGRSSRDARPPDLAPLSVHVCGWSETDLWPPRLPEGRARFIRESLGFCLTHRKQQDARDR